MWTAKLKLNHKDCPIVTRCQKFNLIVLSYPSSWYRHNKRKYATTTCYFQSTDENTKKKFIKELKSDKRITNLETAGDIFTYEINLGKKGEHVMLYYTRQIFFIKPTINHFDGHEYWEIASWSKEVLQEFIKSLRTHMDICIMLKIEKIPLANIYFPNVMPRLSPSQKKAIELAFKEGYYSYPRKITLEQLANISKLGTSTFQEHLRKAEIKLLPVMIEANIKNR